MAERRAAALPTLLGSEDRVVIDLGSRMCRAGFGGDAVPRAMFDAAALGARTLGRELDALWELDMMTASTPRTLQQRHMELLRCLTYILRSVFQDYLLSDARTYRVLLTHSPLGIDALQHALRAVLLGNMQAPSISFVDTHVLSALGAGRPTALVVDCGHLETCAMPVYMGRPLRSLLATTPRAGRRLNETLRALLLQHAQASGTDAPLETLLTADVVESLKTQALVVRPAMAHARVCMPLDPDAFAAVYATDTSASPLTMRLRGGGTLHVPGWLRARAAEVLFEPGDEDEASIVECALQSASRLPLDIRRDVLDAVLLTGGTAMLPDFAPRFESHMAEGFAQGTGRFGAAMLAPPAVHVLRTADVPTPPNLLAWRGASLAGAFRADGTAETTREQWLSST